MKAFKNKKRQLDDGANQELSWETFEFSGVPKLDRRFADPASSYSDDGLAQTNASSAADGSNGTGSDDFLTNEERIQLLQQQETERDARYQEEQRQKLTAWEQLDPASVQRATEAIRPIVNDDRVQRIAAVLEQRTAHTRFLFESTCVLCEPCENAQFIVVVIASFLIHLLLSYHSDTADAADPSNPSNVWACLRTIESFGIQHVDVIMQSDQYKGKAAIHQKRGMRTAVGSAKWLTLRNHASTADAVRALKEQQNCRILASDLNPNSIDIRTMNWDGDGDDDDDRPICIVMGNEERGISEEMRELADETFTLPMVGFAESFNLSVATAITLAHLSASSQNGKGPLRPGDLPRHELDCLMLKGLLNSLPQKRMADALLRQAKVELPTNLLELL